MVYLGKRGATQAPQKGPCTEFVICEALNSPFYTLLLLSSSSSEDYDYNYSSHTSSFCLFLVPPLFIYPLTDDRLSEADCLAYQRRQISCLMATSTLSSTEDSDP